MTQRASVDNHDLVRHIKGLAYRYSEEPFTLVSGASSHDYIDAKQAISTGPDLRLVSEALMRRVKVPFDKVGGLTMGADPLAHGIALIKDKAWFSVRKEPKAHGLHSLIEGSVPRPGDKVLLVDDIVTLGGSIMEALKVVESTGATVVWAATIVDRGDLAAESFAQRGIPYTPLATYKDLEIVRVDPAFTSS